MKPYSDHLARQGFKSPSVHFNYDWPNPNQPELKSSLSQQTSSFSSHSRLGPWASGFVNDYGEVRLKRVRGELDLNEPLDRDKCIRLYEEWVSDDNYMVLKKMDQRGVVEYRACKARKRGNDIDAYRIGRHLRAIKESILEYSERGRRLRSTSVVYVTGTIDPRLVEYDLEYAWQYLGYWFNMFLAILRKRCSGAEIRVFRSWEAHESGWPHFHAILCFEGFSWSIFQDRQSRWRLADKQVFEDAWGFGWIDVLGLTPGTTEKHAEKVVWYITKYVVKSGGDTGYEHVDSWPVKKLPTESILWYFGKRSFSVSRSLIESACAHDLNKRISTIQTDLEGNVIPESQIVWEFVGMVRRKDTDLDRNDWVKSYSNPPDWLDLCWKPRSCFLGLGWTNTWGT